MSLQADTQIFLKDSNTMDVLISKLRLLCIMYIKYFKEGRFEADICTGRKIFSPPLVTRFSLFQKDTQSTDDWSNEYYTIHFQLFGKSHLVRKAFHMINLIPLFPFVCFRKHLTMTSLQVVTA